MNTNKNDEDDLYMLGFRVEFSPLSRLGQWYSSDINEHPEIDSVILEYHLRRNIVY